MTEFKIKGHGADEEYEALQNVLDGTENCYDPNLVDKGDHFVGESVTDLYVEDWTGRGVSKKVAEELCAGCHALEECKAYAMKAQEGYGIWGGTRPIDRGVKRRYRGW